MAWSLDWFSARELAAQGKYIRRCGWTDKWLVLWRGLWWFRLAGDTHVVRADEFGRDDFLARDWTDQPPDADPCATLAAYNGDTPPRYRDWGTPIMVPPPVPGFAEPSS